MTLTMRLVPRFPLSELARLFLLRDLFVKGLCPDWQAIAIHCDPASEVVSQVIA